MYFSGRTLASHEQGPGRHSETEKPNKQEGKKGKTVESQHPFLLATGN